MVDKAKRPSAAAKEPTMAIVEVGATKTKYHIHRALLITHSEYFKKALSGPWKEAQEGIVTPEDIDCETFDIFVNWMYTEKLPQSGEQWLNADAEEDENVKAGPGDDQLALVKAYVFGDRILSPVFHRAVRNVLIHTLTDDLAYYKAVIYAFANLSTEDPVLNLMVDKHCAVFSEELDEYDGEKQRRCQLPSEFLIRVMLRYSRVKNAGWKDELKPCDYHGHASEEERKKCQAERDED